MSKEMRLELNECADSPLILTVHGNSMFSGQSGVHCPVARSRESPEPERPNSTTLVRTGATIGICCVSVAGTWLLSLLPQLFWIVKLVPGASTAHTALLEAADDALYRAKELGRDRIELADINLAQPAGHTPGLQDRAA